jgi:hypothetical protein
MTTPLVIEGIWRETGSVGSSANNPKLKDLFVKYPSATQEGLPGVGITCGSLQSAGATMMYLAKASSGATFGSWNFTVTPRGSASYELVLTTT